ncbi:hypothetical protein METHB2_780003 [Candidatus Methylobacter favarea]|uniref:Uncharacterized protein n=1 Tax=Candidatus Methylobacter favarea TaxID=2707345 RepID=A0A8S0WCM5_9GAMM|nr:hypothetical protein METHB2_780003 [Candidatus Methylobacter favarea]
MKKCRHRSHNKRDPQGKVSLAIYKNTPGFIELSSKVHKVEANKRVYF